MANIGDKFIITIGDKAENEKSGETLYRIKGFKSLVFDENGIEKLEKYEEKKGKWKYNPECVNNADVPEFSCSECDVAMGKYFNFCANCGADMRGEENGKNIAMLTLADSLKEKYGKENDNAD